MKKKVYLFICLVTSSAEKFEDPSVIHKSEFIDVGLIRYIYKQTLLTKTELRSSEEGHTTSTGVISEIK